MEPTNETPPAAPVRRKLTTDERNARTSARQVRRFLSGRIAHDTGYLGSDAMDGREWYFVTTWTGDTLLARVHVTKARVNSFGFPATRFYFTGTDKRGRRWHGSSPGPGMFARLHLNKGPAPRKRPTSRAALARALAALVEGLRIDNRIESTGPLALANHANPFAVPAFADAVKLLYGARR